MAAVNGSLDIVTLLLQHGGDPNLATSYTDKDGKPVVSASKVYNMYVCMHASSFARTYSYIYLFVALLPELKTVLNFLWTDFILV
jgi:hypothetical protein